MDLRSTSILCKEAASSKHNKKAHCQTCGLCFCCVETKGLQMCTCEGNEGREKVPLASLDRKRKRSSGGSSSSSTGTHFLHGDEYDKVMSDLSAKKVSSII